MAFGVYVRIKYVCPMSTHSYMLLVRLLLMSTLQATGRIVVAAQPPFYLLVSLNLAMFDFQRLVTKFSPEKTCFIRSYDCDQTAVREEYKSKHNKAAEAAMSRAARWVFGTWTPWKNNKFEAELQEEDVCVQYNYINK